MPIPSLPNTLRGDIEAKPKTAAMSIMPLRIGAEPDATAVSLMPKKIGRTGKILALPLNELVGDFTGSRTSPEAMAAGAIDLGLDAASLYTPTRPIAAPIKGATNVLNSYPRYIDEEVWIKAGEPYRRKREEMKENINRQGNKIIEWLKPPIPYVDY